MKNHMHVLDAFPPDARVWVYQSSRAFTEAEVPGIERALSEFARQWVSHNRQLRAAGAVLHQRFIVLAVDETQADASGCSIDKSVTFLKNLQAALGVDLFDRMRLAYLDGEEVHSLPSVEFSDRYARGVIDDQTLVLDPLVDTMGKLRESFVKPLRESWHKRLV